MQYLGCSEGGREKGGSRGVGKEAEGGEREDCQSQEVRNECVGGVGWVGGIRIGGLGHEC